MIHHEDTFHDDGPPISQLQAAVKRLDDYVHSLAPVGDKTVISGDDSGTLDSPSQYVPQSTASTGLTPNRRRPSLTPLQLFGRQAFVASKWRDLNRSHIAIVGLNSVGALAAESLVRARIGHILLVDHEKIEMGSMGNMSYRLSEVGFSRTQALRLRLQNTARPLDSSSNEVIQPTDFDSFTADLQNESDLIELKKRLKVSSVGKREGSTSLASPRSPNDNVGLFEALTQKRPYDAVLSCLEDKQTKRALNQICLELSVPLVDVSLSPCSTMISIKTILPGYTCCLECIESNADDLTKATSISNASPASLPHVELIGGGFLAQNTIKFLLEMGDIVPFSMLNVLTFELESYSFPPNPNCPNSTCRLLQEEDQLAQPHAAHNTTL